MSSEEKEMFELDTISDSKSGVLAVAHYTKTLALAHQIVREHPIPTIENDAQKKEAKAFRAVLNRIIKAIDRRRIDTIEDYTADFAKSCNEIKAIFAEHERGFKSVIEEYEAAQLASVVEAPTGKKYVATIKFTDEKLIKKLTDFCAKNGCDLVIK